MNARATAQLLLNLFVPYLFFSFFFFFIRSADVVYTHARE